MRFLAILPIVLCIVSLVLTFLCLFAGDAPGFMEDYALITLNTSRFGENLVNISTNGQGDSSNPLQQIWDAITTTIQDDINDEINALAKTFGLRDFYSLHVLDVCEGYYEPGALPNATLSSSQIWQNVTSCSNRTGLLTWDPKQEIEDEISKAGFGFINITQYNWPSGIQDSIDELKGEFRATFILYCISIALMFLAFFMAIASIFFLGRVFSFINVGIDLLAFLAIAVASSLVTAVMIEGTRELNGYGNPSGIQAYYSGKFLAITWVSTAFMFIASCVWCFDCIIGRRDKDSRRSRRSLRSREHSKNVKMHEMKGNYGI